MLRDALGDDSGQRPTRQLTWPHPRYNPECLPLTARVLWAIWRESWARD